MTSSPPWVSQANPKALAERLDEGLDVLAAAWWGRAVSDHGTTQHVDDITFLPRPIQRPRIPRVGWRYLAQASTRAAGAALGRRGVHLRRMG
jgi:alkanesulfonate monooxygenase SsuD/methylene tetrahydromethanopterin reductase-like flavin-dependent oxidoreductase (luciferase family)